MTVYVTTCTYCQQRVWVMGHHVEAHDDQNGYYCRGSGLYVV